ncbi:MAG: glycosyltransferase family 4 protein, partial [Pseudomonadota bacterium]
MTEGAATDVPVDLRGRHVVFVVTEDWYFWSHRLPLARAARDAGAEVTVATRVTGHGERIEREGVRLVDVPFDRSGLHPGRDAATLVSLVRLYRTLRPDLVHHVAMKPVLYGSLAARLAGVPAVVNAMAGLGFVFTAEGRAARLLRRPVAAALALACRRANTRVIVQNEDDLAVFTQRLGVRPEQIALIAGSGVDLDLFRPLPEPPTPPVVAVCAARMLWDKGIGELVEAARLLHREGVPLRVRLVGDTDANPRSISEATLAAWQAEGVVDVVGRSEDIAGEYARAHVAVLPSYREGLPKALLEAAACGRPMISTATPGCRDVCRDGETGLSVPPRDPAALAAALARLAGDAEL